MTLDNLNIQPQNNPLESVEYKTIANYLNIPMFEIEELDVVEYKFFLREAFIYKCSKTEEVLEY